MKKLLLFFLLNSTIGIYESIAQPANDDCSTSQAIGSLPVPASCFGTSLNITGTLVGATPSSPYAYLTSCSGAGGSAMSFPANDVWYTFTATSYQLVATVTSTFANPNVALFTGNCSSLYASVGGCAVGTGGAVTLTVEQMSPGSTYYLLISGNGTQTGTFNLDIKNNKDCVDCMIGSNLTITPLPVNVYQTSFAGKLIAEPPAPEQLVK